MTKKELEEIKEIGRAVDSLKKRYSKNRKRS